jgi:hypothetical protein
MRKHVFINTTLFHPALIRASVDLLGAENVIAGSDWPIAGAPIRGMLRMRCSTQNFQTMSRAPSPQAIACGCWA